MKLRSDVSRVVREYRCSIEPCAAQVRIATVWFTRGAYPVTPPEWRPPEYVITQQTTMMVVQGKLTETSRSSVRTGEFQAAPYTWEGGVGISGPLPEDGWLLTYSGTFCPDHAPLVLEYEAANSLWWMKRGAEKKTWWETLGQMLPKPLRDQFAPETPGEPKPVPPWETS